MKKNVKNLQIKLCYPVEKIFDNIVNGITSIKTDNVECPDDIFYFDNDKYIASYNQKNKYFWCDYYTFWSKFELNNTFNYSIIRYLFNDMIEEDFKFNSITTNLAIGGYFYEGEEHFKLKGITTLSPSSYSDLLVEEHFKFKK